MPPLRVRYLLLFTRLFPLWLSYLLLAFLFFLVWFDPTPIGWEGALQLRAFVFVEIVTVLLVSWIVSGVDGPGGIYWAGATLMCVGVWLATTGYVGRYAAAFLVAHLFAHVAAVGAEERTLSQEQAWTSVSVVMLGGAWALAGLLPLPEMGWTVAETPVELWWEMPRWGGSQRIPQGLPSWAVLYFAGSSVVSLWRK